MNDRRSLDLFADAPEPPGAMGCRVEIAATMAQALEASRKAGISRAQVAERMAFHLGEKVSEATINGYTAQSHAERDITLMRARAMPRPARRPPR